MPELPEDHIQRIMEAGRVYLNALNKVHPKVAHLIDLASTDVVLALGYAFSMSAFSAVATVTGATKQAEADEAGREV